MNDDWVGEEEAVFYPLDSNIGIYGSVSVLVPEPPHYDQYAEYDSITNTEAFAPVFESGGAASDYKDLFYTLILAGDEIKMMIGSNAF